MRTGLVSFKPSALAGRHADGLLLVCGVDDVDAEHRRLVAARPDHNRAGDRALGERYFQVIFTLVAANGTSS